MGITTKIDNGILTMIVAGKLTDSDYTDPDNGLLEVVQKYGASVDDLKLLIVLNDFEGWEGTAETNEWALLRELKHKNCDVAMVGAQGAIKAMISLMATFIHHPVCKYFDTEEAGVSWLIA